MILGRKYRCIYCQKPLERHDLIRHIELKHEDMIPEEYPVDRLVFDICNNKEIGNGHGTCSICKGPTPWDAKSGRYKVYCSDKCRNIMRENAVKNMIKVHGVPTLLNDIEHQEKMLAARKISGKYKFSDGGVCVYTGSYEKKLLEFMDKVMNISSDDIIMPGPVVEYDYNGETKKYITDMMYLPYNLIIEVKDGGDNPNKVVDQSEVRKKTVAKETAIVKLGKFNYLRLTNNNFVQLLDIFVDLREKVNNEDESKTYRINEYCANIMGAMVGGHGVMPQERLESPIFITQYRGENDVKDQYYMSNDIVSSNVISVENNKLKKNPIEKHKGRCNVFKYIGDHSAEILTEVYRKYKTGEFVSDNYIAELVTESIILCSDQLHCCPLLEEVQLVSDAAKTQIATFVTESAAIKNNKAAISFSVISPFLYDKVTELTNLHENIDIRADVDGYFAVNTVTKRRTTSVKDFDALESMISTVEL